MPEPEENKQQDCDCQPYCRCPYPVASAADLDDEDDEDEDLDDEDDEDLDEDEDEDEDDELDDDWLDDDDDGDDDWDDDDDEGYDFGDDDDDDDDDEEDEPQAVNAALAAPTAESTTSMGIGLDLQEAAEVQRTHGVLPDEVNVELVPDPAPADDPVSLSTRAMRASVELSAVAFEAANLEKQLEETISELGRASRLTSELRAHLDRSYADRYRLSEDHAELSRRCDQAERSGLVYFLLLMLALSAGVASTVWHAASWLWATFFPS